MTICFRKIYRNLDIYVNGTNMIKLFKNLTENGVIMSQFTVTITVCCGYIFFFC